MSKILVTGGLGYIGSHTVVELVKAGKEVLVIDDLSNSHADVQLRIEEILGQKIDVVIADIADTAKVIAALREVEIDGVIHFAAFKAVGESVEQPLKYYRNNIGGLIALLEIMHTKKVNKLIFSSSCTVYGEAEHLPVTEHHPIQQAESPYGATKILGEQIINDYCKHSPLKAIHLRYFNPVGAHESGLIGELPLGIPNNLVPFICQTAAGLREQLTVFGSDYNTPDGTCIRDYIHVVDLAQAHVRALEFVNDQQKQVEVFNVGTGKGHSVKEVIHTFEQANRIKLNWEEGPRRPGDVEQIWADTHKVNEKLGWHARYGLQDMMKHAWLWQQNLIQKV